MKKILVYLVFLFLAFIAGMIVANKQNQKHYDAACILSDVIRASIDSGDSDLEELYYDTIYNLDCLNVNVSKEDMDNYYYCY